MATASLEQEQAWAEEHTKPPFLRRVRISGYKSIAFCDVELHPFTILVGRNGSGKSNFLDALAFLRDSLALGLPEAVRRHGGTNAIVCRAANTEVISIALSVALHCHTTNAICHADYAIQVEFPGLRIRQESCRIHRPDGPVGFEVNNGRVEWTGPVLDSHRTIHHLDPIVLLLSMFGLLEFSDLNRALRVMAFYNFSPNTIRQLQHPNPGYLLESDGWNLASVIQTLKDADPDQFQRAREYLSYINDDVESFDPVRYADFETVLFRMKSKSGKEGLTFNAESMSDGTLRALAAIIAGFQVAPQFGHPSVVGIEEPETSLHPAAIRELVGALRGATEHTQVLLTSHSADFLEDREFQPEELLVVRTKSGLTQIGPVDAASREIARRELYTLGGLQRMGQLEPDWRDLERQAKVRTEAGGG